MNQPVTSRPQAAERFFANSRAARWAGSGMLALVALMAVLVPAHPLALDQSWSELMRDLQTPVLTDIAKIFNWLGRAPGRAIAFAIVALLLLRSRRWVALVAFAIAESVSSLCSGLLKAVVGRPRPPDGLIHPLGNSFPSGHATYAAAISVAAVLLFTTPGPQRRPWWALATLFILGMAWSRTYLQVHWLSDVVAGALLGSGVAVLTFALAQRD